MFKKYKQLFIGFILVAIMLNIVPVGAAVKQYILTESNAKLVIDGAEVNNPELPVLNYEDYNYIPAATFREICAKLGIDFQWIEETSQIQINTLKTKEVEKVQTSSKNRTTEDGLPIININGKDYVSTMEINKKYWDGRIPKSRNQLGATWYGINSIGSKFSLQKGELVEKANPVTGAKYNDYEVITILDNVPFQQFYTEPEGVYVELDYYINTILPLIK